MTILLNCFFRVHIYTDHFFFFLQMPRIIVTEFDTHCHYSKFYIYLSIMPASAARKGLNIFTSRLITLRSIRVSRPEARARGSHICHRNPPHEIPLFYFKFVSMHIDMNIALPSWWAQILAKPRDLCRRKYTANTLNL